MKITDPSNQRHHTFGGSLAAERLVKEIDSGANYHAAVRILNKSHAFANDISKLPEKSRKYFLHLLREDAVKHINFTNSDQIVKSLCRNVVIAKIRSQLKK